MVWITNQGRALDKNSIQENRIYKDPRSSEIQLILFGITSRMGGLYPGIMNTEKRSKAW